MDTQIEELIAIIAVVGGLSLAYGRAIGSYQTEISQAVIDATQTATRYKRLVNFAVGITLATGFTVVGAMWLGTWELAPAGVLAGILASVEASRAHDEAAVESRAIDQLMEQAGRGTG